MSARCVVCGRDKKPIGRDAPIGSSYCEPECAGYQQESQPSSCWPDEQAEYRDGFIDTQILNALRCLGDIINDAPFVAEERDGACAAFLENQKTILDAVKRLRHRHVARWYQQGHVILELKQLITSADSVLSAYGHGRVVTKDEAIALSSRLRRVWKGVSNNPHTCHDMNPPFPGECLACRLEAQ